MTVRGQHGQALTEFLVLALALIPLFVLIPYIAKYQDISHATQMAARYVAFDATINFETKDTGPHENSTLGAWKTKTRLEDEVRRRFFGNSDAPIKTNDTAGNFDAHRNPFWQGPQGDPLIKEFSDVSVFFGDKKSTHKDGLTASKDGQPFAEDLKNWYLKPQGVYSAGVSVKLANIKDGLKFYEPFDKIDLSISRQTALVFDPWAATGPGSAKASDVSSRIAGGLLVNELIHNTVSPQAKLAIGAIEVVGSSGQVPLPRLGMDWGFYQDVVPQDRLKPYK